MTTQGSGHITPTGWQILAAVGMLILAVWGIVSPRTEIDGIKKDYLPRTEFNLEKDATQARLNETTKRLDQAILESSKRLDQRLDDVNRQLQQLGVISSQLTDLWEKYYRDVNARKHQ